LSRRNKEKRHHQQPEPDSKIYFSFGTVKLLKDALNFFEAYLLAEPEKTPNLPFVKEVTANLKIKFSDMLEREEWNKDTPLDYNEIHLLFTACHMYLIQLKFTHQYALISPCTQLCKQLARVIDHVNKEVEQEKRKK
jgi:hypothetical protein